MIKRLLWSLCICALAGIASAQTITAAEYFVDTDPGVGLGTPLTVSTPGASVPLAGIVSTTGLTPHMLHRVNMRVQTASGLWSKPTPAILAVTANDGVARVVTQVDYQVDNGAVVPVDVVDAAIVNWSDLVSTTGLTDGLHHLRIRARDNAGRIGALNDGFFVVASNVFPPARQVATIDYWFDSDAPTSVDVADAATVNWNSLLATTSLPIGLHTFNVRSTDNTGRAGVSNRSLLIVTGAFVVGQPRQITAAEYFVNVDPGPGNGVSIPLPGDGTWDEGTEDEALVLTGLPIGLHLLGIRTRDDVGRWSPATRDSIIVGPVLTVRFVGGNLVLDWLSGAGASQYKIYRAPTFGGTYALVDSTVVPTYTDATVVPAPATRFYHVTFDSPALSSYRLPEAAPARE